MTYASYGIIAFIIHLIINFSRLKNNKEYELTDAAKRYRYFLIGVMLYYATDFLWGILYEFRFEALGVIMPVLYIDTVLYFAAMVISVLLWTAFVVTYLNREYYFSTVITCAGWIIFIYELFTIAFNFFVPVIFSFDTNNDYRTGHARYVTLGIQIILYLVVSIYTLFVANGEEGRTRSNYLTVGLSGLVMTGFILLQICFALFPFYSIGCLVATCLIHSFVEEARIKEVFVELDSAKELAYTDSLTGAKNIRAYENIKNKIDYRISEKLIDEFAVVVFDINGLKDVNDISGHEEGDSYIKDAGKIISDIFTHSQVYRIGGDGFVVVLEGEDYKNRTELMDSFNKMMEDNKRSGQVVVAGGMAEYDPVTDLEYVTVFERADRNMYIRKRELKG